MALCLLGMRPKGLEKLLLVECCAQKAHRGAAVEMCCTSALSMFACFGVMFGLYLAINLFQLESLFIRQY